MAAQQTLWQPLHAYRLVSHCKHASRVRRKCCRSATMFAVRDAHQDAVLALRGGQRERGRHRAPQLGGHRPVLLRRLQFRCKICSRTLHGGSAHGGWRQHSFGIAFSRRRRPVQHKCIAKLAGADGAVVQKCAQAVGRNRGASITCLAYSDSVSGRRKPSVFLRFRASTISSSCKGTDMRATIHQLESRRSRFSVAAL